MSPRQKWRLEMAELRWLYGDEEGAWFMLLIWAASGDE